MKQHDSDMTGSVLADTRTMPIVHSALRRDLTRTRLVLTYSRSLSQEHNIQGRSFRELAVTGLWTLDGQDPASHALMRQVAPRPVMFVIDNVFGPRFRRRSARLWGGTRAAVVPALDKQRKEVTP